MTRSATAAAAGRRTSTAEIRGRLQQHANAAYVPILQRFFKTARGEYGEGDVFLGVSVPSLRTICRECRGAGIDEVEPLLRSHIHEERLLALLMLVDMFQRADERGRRRIYSFYLANTQFINNWDLVDSSAPQIVGAWLSGRSRVPLGALAKSRSLWERRIAIIATHYFIQRGEFDDALAIADMLLRDDHDLIHKAVGWTLREIGDRNPAVERRFLRAAEHADWKNRRRGEEKTTIKPRYRIMPRTMLRYAIEKFPVAERKRYLKGKM